MLAFFAGVTVAFFAAADVVLVCIEPASSRLADCVGLGAAVVPLAGVVATTLEAGVDVFLGGAAVVFFAGTGLEFVLTGMAAGFVLSTS